MGATEHQDRMAETMAMTMSQAAARCDLETFNQDLVGYMLGCVARAQKVDGEGMPGVMRNACSSRAPCRRRWPQTV
jgi:hypothetical protein